ncbi:MMPL family transporter [Nonomuraea sp. SBT364]|uniref:MMPL family transporter n=1 Tax=Nonomuraea sp. SBT364 TaxID=1580530 RepID=UPI00066C3CAA|nr:MMPL family transporter [Nonomuraea sp. SBT364]
MRTDGRPGASLVPLSAYARWCVGHRRRLLSLAVLLTVILGLASLKLDSRLSNGGYTARGTQAARAEAVMARRFPVKPADLVLRVTARESVDAPGVAKSAGRLDRWLAARPGVSGVQSYWTTRDPALRARDGRSALIRVDLSGDDARAARTAERIVPPLAERAGSLKVAATGPAWASVQFLRLAKDDLHRAELVTVPLLLLILLVAFRSVHAALLPLAIGGLTIVGTLTALVLVSEFTPVSVFAPNLTTALGLGLAIDYSLFITTRYREELARGCTVRQAVERAMASAGHTVLFSALTVALATANLLVLPLGVLRSLALTTIIVVLMAAAATMLILPALLAVVGERISGGDPFAWLRRSAHRRPVPESAAWRRIAALSTRRPVLVGGSCALVLLLMAAPFLWVRFGIADERVLPADTESHRTAHGIHQDFDQPFDRDLHIVLPYLDSSRPAGCRRLAKYAHRLAALPDVTVVRTTTGVYRGAAAQETPCPPEDPPAKAAEKTEDTKGKAFAQGFHGSAATLISVSGPHDAQSAGARELLDRVRDVRPPGTRLVTGPTPQAVDTLGALRNRLPLAGGLIAITVLTLLFLFTGGVLVSVKAVAVGALSLTASCGALVAIFQDGHLRGLLGDFTLTHHVEVVSILLTVTVAFGLSVDYEVFLLSRIREHHRATGDHTAAVVRGIAGTGRLVSVAALAVAVSTGFLAFSTNTVLKIIGVGLALSVLVDATLVRGLLVPAFMRLTGTANWWAPAPLARLHERFGISEAEPPPGPPARRPRGIRRLLGVLLPGTPRSR